MKNAIENLRKQATEIIETEGGGVKFVFSDGEKITFPKGSQFLAKQSFKKKREWRNSFPFSFLVIK